MPMINVFELDARLYSINNRRLFVLKVLASMGKLDFVTAKLLPRQHPTLQRQKFDRYRIHGTAPKWERHLSSETSGLVVRVKRRGSNFEDRQAVPPSQDWFHNFSTTFPQLKHIFFRTCFAKRVYLFRMFTRRGLTFSDILSRQETTFQIDFASRDNLFRFFCE